jgi:hypothetical protein
VGAPLDLELEEVGRDPPPLGVGPRALLDEVLHPLDELGGGEAGLRVGLAPELAVDDRAHALEHAPHQPLDQRLVALLLFLVAHKWGVRLRLRDRAGAARRQRSRRAKGEGKQLSPEIFCRHSSRKKPPGGSVVKRYRKRREERDN